MATWILLIGIVVLVLILGGALFLVLLFTRGESDDDVRLPRFRRFGARSSEDAATPNDDD
jgi:hypothetical protein